MMSTAELGLAIAESLRYLGNINIPGDFSGNVDVKIPTDDIILLYEIFEQLIENNMSEILGIYVKLENSAGVILKMIVEGVNVVLDDDIKEKLFQAGIPVSVRYEDEISYVRFRLKKEVEEYAF